MADPSAPSPPKGITSSPSIFAYQTRLLERTSSMNGGHRSSPNSTSVSRTGNSHGNGSIAALADSPPSTPIRKNVAKMAAGLESAMTTEDSLSRSNSRRAGLGMGGRPGHSAGSKSVDLVRGQWEAKISGANSASASPSPSVIHISKRNSVVSPLISSSAAMTSEPGSMTPPMTPSAPTVSASAPIASRLKRSTVAGMEGWDPSKLPSTPGSRVDAATSIDTTTPASVTDNVASRPRPASISHTSVLSPDSTGNSSAASGRSQSVEDTLAVARANALKRLEARRKAQGDTTTVTATPSIGAPIEAPEVEARKSSPFGDLFSPPSNSSTAADSTPTKPIPALANDKTPTNSSRPTYRSIVTPPSAPPVTSRYNPSGLSAAPTSGSSGAGAKDKYGSISKTDRRRLGRHLPRIASGGEGWDEEAPGHAREPSGKRVPSTLSRSSGLPPQSAVENTPPSSLGKASGQAVQSALPTDKTPVSISKMDNSSADKTPNRLKPIEILAPSRSENRPTAPASPTVPTTPTSKRRSAYLINTPRTEALRPELTGADMKGLMNAVGSLPARGAINDEGQGVTGMSNRLRLSKSTLPPSASSASVAPAPLPSRRLIQTNWMDRQRHALAAYEYLCHVGEAQQWIEGCLDEELEFGVTEMEEGLRDGVVLAKLARVFQGESVVKSIWTETKHRYKQTDNINHFLKFVRTVGMPETFTFDVTDLYNAKNVPKVIFCIHVLSHLLARLGRAERIGNLVGQFDFTDEQLAAKQKDLQGVAMPNFGDARNTLAKEASWEPEEPEESEEEVRDRLLLECEGSIVHLQKHLRGRLSRMRTSRVTVALELAEPITVRFQARARGALSRRALLAEHDERAKLHSWATVLQTASRRTMARHHHQTRVAALHGKEQAIVGMQAQARGVLARVRRASAQNYLDKASRNVVALQSACRGCLARRVRKHHRQTVVQPQVVESITSFQAVLRGRLHRQNEAKQLAVVQAQAATFTSLQSQLRGALVRRNRKAHEEKMDDATDYVVAIQAAARGLLARRKKQSFTKVVQQVVPAVTSLQALARARLARQTHQSMQKALAKVEVAGSVGGLQAFLRTRLAKRQTTEQKKKLEFVQPDVIGFQAVARGYLARQEYRDWRDYLLDPHTQGALVFLQSLVRGFLARRRLFRRVDYIHRNVDKVVKVQSLWRGRVQRQMYDKLLTGVEVDVPTVQNYMHLLDDTETDFADQIRAESLRKNVVALIRENQGLETEVEELSTKIALIVKNQMSLEEMARAKRRGGHGHGPGEHEAFAVIGNNDPFSGAHLDRTSQRKLELFEHLFFTLQTKADYLVRLLRALAKEDNDADRKLVESVTLILFGFGHERREQYLFHKVLQLSMHTEVLLGKSLEALVDSRFAVVSLATQYAKPDLAPYLGDMLVAHVQRIVDAPALDLTTNPLEIYNRIIDYEEAQLGVPSKKPRDLVADQVLQTDADARATYIRHLQELRFLTAELLQALYKAAGGLPYTVRYLAREVLLALRVKYPDSEDRELTPIVAKTVILPFVTPALIAPESYGMVDQPIGPKERKNLAAIAHLIGCIASPDVALTQDRFVRVPLAEYIQKESAPFRDWVLDVASVEALETFFEAHELFDSTLEAKPIEITRQEIYGTLSVLMKHIPVLTAGKANDPIETALQELEGPPIDYDRSKATVSLRLTNRLAELQPTGPEAMIKEDFVQAKRHVLAVLRVQTGRTLYDVLVVRPEEVHEQRWLEEVYRDIALEKARAAKHNLPPTPVEAGYQIESIRSLPFHEVKSRAIEFCMKLERAGRISRKDHFQGLLVSIASDIRQKHHLRKLQRQNLAAMTKAYEDTTRKKQDFLAQIESYHEFIDSSMANLQKGKKKPTFLSRQFRHQRQEAKLGKKAQFGSFKYSALELHDKGILLGVRDFSPRQYNQITIVLASNEIGIFSLEISVPPGLGAGLSGREEVRMEDLLQAQFDNQLNLLLFEGAVTFSIDELIKQINKKFYSTS